MDDPRELARAGARLLGDTRFAEALATFDRALAADPTLAPVYINRAAAHLRLSEYESAVADCDAALALRPDLAEAHNNRGVALNALARPHDALASFDAALALKPDHAGALVNRAAALQALGDRDAALDSLDRAIAINPANAEAHYYRGSALYLMNRRGDAMASFEYALSLAPNDPDIEYAKGVALLGFGALEEGWPLFEARWRARLVRMSAPLDRGEPAWHGGAVVGVLRIWAEQGVGEAVLFSRLLPLAHLRAPRIVLECDARLAPLMRRAFPWLEDVCAPGRAPAAAAQCALGGLGAAMGVSESMLGKRADYLKADPARRAAMHQRYAEMAGGRQIVGIAWRSTNAELGRLKSSALDDWGALLSVSCFFVNLQYGDTRDEVVAAQRKFGCEIFNDPEIDQIADLDGFAAQIATVDEVVSVSNTTVHMAGALGAPCTLIAPNGRGLIWYWGVSGDEAPWYRSVHVVRRKPGEEIAAHVARAAANIIALA